MARWDPTRSFSRAGPLGVPSLKTPVQRLLAVLAPASAAPRTARASALTNLEVVTSVRPHARCLGYLTLDQVECRGIDCKAVVHAQPRHVAYLFPVAISQSTEIG